MQLVSGGKHSLCPLQGKEALSSPRSILDNDVHSKHGFNEYARLEHRLLQGNAEIDGSYIIPCYFGDDSGRFIRENFLRTPHTSQWRRQVMNLLSQGKDIIFSSVSSPELEMNFMCKVPESKSRSIVV